MTEDRSQQFDRDLASVLRQAAGDGAPASLRYRLADVTATPPLERRSWFAPPLRWAAVAVAAVAVAVLAFLMMPHENVGPTPTSSAQPTATPVVQSGSPTPSGEASPTGSPSVLPSPTEVPTQAPAAWSTLTWSKAVAMPDGQFLNDLVRWRDGYVGVGGIDTGSGLDAAFFTSTDGTHWTVVQRQTSAQHNVFAATVLRVGDRLLAVAGFIADFPGDRPTVSPPLWSSSDGVTWAAVDSPTWDAAFSTTWPGRVLSAPQGLVAVTFGADPVLIFSSDGATWRAAALPVIERAVVSDAAASTNGFVVVGRDGQPNPNFDACADTCPTPGVGRPAAWQSADGMHWAEATVQGTSVSAAQMSRVLPVRGGYVATGIASTADYYDQKPTGWTSSDGRTWSIVDGLRLPDASGPYPVLAADGDQALVVGFHPDSSGLPVWVSSGSSGWTRLSATDAPLADCAGKSSCLRPMKAWVVPGGFVLMATPGPMTPQTFWVVAGS